MITDIKTRILTREDLGAVSVILEQTELFPANMLANMAEPFLSGQAPHIWILACADTKVLALPIVSPKE